MLALLAPVAMVSALAAGSLPAIQIVRLWCARSSAGISIVWVLGGLANSVVWTAYALSLGSLPLILPNVLGLAMNLAMTTVVFAVRHPRLAADVAHPIAHVAKAVVHDAALAAEFAALVEAHEAERFSAAETLVLRPGDLSLSA
jgi:sugar efflux transporter for intercellular exchange